MIMVDDKTPTCKSDQLTTIREGWKRKLKTTVCQ